MPLILIIFFIVNYRRLRFTVLMDDVWVVIGLLLFGSLLFCLCCYKVSNLLYMLYHIDDDPDSTAPNPAGGVPGDLTAVGVASAANAAAAAVIASATSGLSAKGSFKGITATKTNASPTDPDPDRVQPGVSNVIITKYQLLYRYYF